MRLLWQQAQAPIYIATDELVFMGWCCLGGLGCTLPLNILMIRSRSKKISTIGKAAIASSIFNINERLCMVCRLF